MHNFTHFILLNFFLRQLLLDGFKLGTYSTMNKFDFEERFFFSAANNKFKLVLTLKSTEHRMNGSIWKAEWAKKYCLVQKEKNHFNMYVGSVNRSICVGFSLSLCGREFRSYWTGMIIVEKISLRWFSVKPYFVKVVDNLYDPFQRLFILLPRTLQYPMAFYSKQKQKNSDEIFGHFMKYPKVA